MFNLSPMHLLVILVVALLLFGNRLPEVARSLGRAFNEFKRGLRDVNEGFGGDDPGGKRDEERPRLKPPEEGVAHSDSARAKEPQLKEAPRRDLDPDDEPK